MPFVHVSSRKSGPWSDKQMHDVHRQSTKRATTAHCCAGLCSVLYHAFLHYQVSDSTVITHNGVSGPLHTLPEFKRRLKTIIEVQ